MQAIKTFALGALFAAAGAVAAEAVSPPPGFGRITHARDRQQPLGCSVLPNVHAGEIWQGLFRGERFEGGNQKRRVGGRFCFTSLSDCQAWLHDMNSMNHGAIRANDCRRLR